MATTSQRPHRAIDSVSGDIRLISLNPSPSDEAEVHCDLLYATLHEHPPYEALSYVCGDQTVTRNVFLDGKALPVTVNLESALRHLRDTERTRTLWVDALCIDQENLGERRDQVGHMSEIYKFCETDIVWLGPSDPDLAAPLELLKSLQPLYVPKERFGEEMVKMGGWAWTNPAERSESRWKQPQYKRTYIPHQSLDNETGWQALDIVFTYNNVFDRIWIVQEVALASNVMLQLGHETLEWDFVNSFLDASEYADAYHATYSHDTRSILASCLERPQMWEHQRRAVRDPKAPQKSQFLDVLARFRRLEATDPRDKIFGLLGLSPTPPGIEADYRKSVADVYTEFTIKHIRESRTLDIIAQSQWEAAANRDRRPDVPTWVPDFSNPGISDLLFAQRGIFAAGSENCGSWQVREDRLFVIHGIKLGTLAESRQTIEPEKQSGHWLNDLFLGWLPSELTSRPPASTYLGKEDLSEAFWRTLLVDCYQERGELTKRLDGSSFRKVSEELNRWREAQSEPDKPAYLSRTWNLMARIDRRFKFAETSELGLFCMVPKAARPTDEIAVFAGAKVPMLLSQVSNPDASNCTYKVVGPAYVHGFMDGQASVWEKEGKLQSREYVLM